jgi:hypothetical protein
MVYSSLMLEEHHSTQHGDGRPGEAEQRRSTGVYVMLWPGWSAGIMGLVSS